MKIRINKKLKKILLSFIFVLFLVMFILLTIKLINPGMNEETVCYYNYSNKANIDYNVFLKPNILYDDEYIGQDNIYITEFVDYIKAQFNYEFKVDKEVKIEGEYEVFAEIEGYTGSAENYTSIWKKKVELISKTPFSVNDNNFVLQEEVPIKLEEYNDLARKVIEDSKTSAQVKMTVFWNVNINSETDKGIIEENISPSIIIPLNNNYFKITGELSQDKEGAIKENKQVKAPLNKKILNICAILGFISLLALIFLKFFTEQAPEEDPLEKRTKKIFKNYGDRLVAFDSGIKLDEEKFIKVNSIIDLVRVADEIGKPIMYEYNSSSKKILRYYIFDNMHIYILDISLMIINNESSLSKLKNKLEKVNI